MKKYIILCGLMLALFLPSSAQNSMPKMAIGVQTGVQNTWPAFAGTRNLARGYLLGAYGGVQFQYMSSRMLGFESNLLYTNVGWQEPSEQGTYSRKIKAIEWQLNTHLAIGKKVLRLLADAGPYMRFFISDTPRGPRDFPEYNVDFDNNFQFGLKFGGGLGVRFPKFIIQARGHFHMGLSHFFDTDFSVFFESTDQAAGGNLSIMIPFGKEIN